MTIEFDEIELPQQLQDLLATLPATMDRRDGAKLVSDHLFPVSPATLKAWPLGWTAPNGRSIAKTERYLKYGYHKARKAGPTTNRWHRASLQTATTA